MTNFTSKQGDTIVLASTITRPDPFTGEVGPVDITLAKLFFTAKYNLSDSDEDALVQLGTDSPLSGIERSATPTDGKAVITVPADVTDGLSDETVFVFWDLQMEEADSTVTTLDFGRLALTKDATRTT